MRKRRGSSFELVLGPPAAGGDRACSIAVTAPSGSVLPGRADEAKPPA